MARLFLACFVLLPLAALALPPPGEEELDASLLQESSSLRAAPGKAGLLLPLCSMLAASALLCLGFWWHCRGVCNAQTARSSFVLQAGVQGFLFSVVIVESLDLCTRLGRTQAMSGQMVGIFQIGLLCGATVSWLALRAFPEVWREPRRLFFMAHAGQLLAALAYLWVAAEASSAAPRREMFWLLMLSRWLSGVCSTDSFSMSCSMHITAVAERPEHTARVWFARLLFMGMGPLAAAGLLALDASGTAGFCLVGCCQVVTAVTAAFATFCVRGLEDVQDCVEGKSSCSEGRYGSRAVVLGCTLLAALRSLGVTGIETGLTLQWEELHRWDHRRIGLVTGAAFLCCIPIKALHSLGRLGPLAWIHIMSALALLGAAFLFPGIARALGGHGGLVLAGSAALIFPCLWLSDAIAASIMYQHVLPEGSCLDSNRMQLWYAVSACVSRYLGCWLARLTVHCLGPDAFALQCLLVIAIFPVVFCLLVQPSINPRHERMPAPDESLLE